MVRFPTFFAIAMLYFFTAAQETKRAEVFARLESKQAGRLADRLKRRDETAADKDPTQSANAFWLAFNPDNERMAPIHTI